MPDALSGMASCSFKFPQMLGIWAWCLESSERFRRESRIETGAARQSRSWESVFKLGFGGVFQCSLAIRIERDETNDFSSIDYCLDTCAWVGGWAGTSSSESAPTRCGFDRLKTVCLFFFGGDYSTSACGVTFFAKVFGFCLMSMF